MNQSTMKINLPYSTLEQAKSLKNDDRAYRNSLALYAADWYLKCLQFSTNLAQQKDWWMKYISKSANLEIPGVGILECIPVMDDAVTVKMPLEARLDRIGYIFIRLNDDYTSAEVIGFTPNYREEVRLDCLQSTDRLIDYLSELESPLITTAVNKLGDSIDKRLNAVWEEIYTLFTPKSLIHREAYRSIRHHDVNAVHKPRTHSISAGRVIQLDEDPENTLVLSIEQWYALDDTYREMHFRIEPQDAANITLPTGLKFIALDEHGTAVSTVETKAGDVYGEIVLDGESGERFSIAIESNSSKHIEKFEI